MPDRLFPRWCGALFALLPLSEILYLPADAQSLYAAAAACAAAGLLAAGAARLSSAVAGAAGRAAPARARSALSARVLALAHEQLSPRDRVYARAAVGALSRTDALRPCARAERTERLRDVGAACGVSGRGGRGAVRRADRRRAAALASCRADSGAPAAVLVAAAPAAAGHAHPCALAARQQSCRGGLAPDSRQAVRCLRCCRSARRCCSALTPPPCFPIRTSLLPGLPRSGILHATARCFSRCRSFCARPGAAPRS